MGEATICENDVLQRLCGRIHEHAERTGVRSIDHVRYGYFEEVDAGWRDNGVCVKVLHDGATMKTVSEHRRGTG